MPRIVPYAEVLATLEGLGCRAAYPNGGVFAPPEPERALGLLTGADPTLRPGLDTRRLADPTPAGLAAALVEGWAEAGGPIWLMPAHHWAYELQHSGKTWAADLLRDLGLDPAALADRTRADALAFDPGEADALRAAAAAIWANLDRSDFAAALPESDPVRLALLHHHGQLWWRQPAAGR